MKENLVSIIIPVFNGKKYLNDCLEALLRQTYKDIEVIIVDDGSTDGTDEELKKYKEKFLKNKMNFIIITQKNSGQAAAVNNALKYVSGEFMVWQDCDDYYEDDAIENLCKYLKLNEDKDFVRGESVYRDESNMQRIIYEGKSMYPNEEKIFDLYLFEKDTYNYPGIFMVRMKFFDRCIKNREIYVSRGGQNWQLILPLAYYGKCGYLNKVVYNYRVCQESHSHLIHTRKQKINRCNEHKDILINTLNDLDMNKGLLFKYKTKIRFKYFKKKTRINLSSVKRNVLGGFYDRNRK